MPEAAVAAGVGAGGSYRDTPSPMPPNLFADAAPPATGETFTALARLRNVVVERIVSSATPAPDLYVQAQDEWVVLLRGTARLEVEGAVRDLREGDTALLPAGTPHRVLATSAGAVWLAVHVHPG